MTWIVPVSSKGQVTLPVAVRRTLGVVPGKHRIVLQKKRDSFSIQSAPMTLYDLKGFLSTHPKHAIPVQRVLDIARKKRAAYIASNG